MLASFPVIVVGAGFFGATVAERIASQLQIPVAVLDRRNHIGGNAYSEIDPGTGIEVHKYGTHIFHTSSKEVWKYLSNFTEFNEYKHRVLAMHRGRVFSMPINLMTICNFFNCVLTPDEARKLIADQALSQGSDDPSNLEDKAISLIGRPLYEAFIRGYTLKQWQTDPRSLPPEIISRLPVRYSFNDRYFSDAYEGLPLNGYTMIFKRMLSHPRIAVFTGVDFFSVRQQISPQQLVVYTGPIDQFFGYREGRLNWRTINFEKEVRSEADYQGTSVINYVDLDVPFTRIHEFRHLHPERRYSEGAGTVIFREYSKAAGPMDEPYYPVGTPDDKGRYRSYREMANVETAVIFGGRLGTYRYLDMHQAIGAALKAFVNEVAPRLIGPEKYRSIADMNI